MDEQSSKSQRELRQQIRDQSKSLNDEIRQKYESLRLRSSVRPQTGTDKTDRLHWRHCYGSGDGLNNDFKIPARMTAPFILDGNMSIQILNAEMSE